MKNVVIKQLFAVGMHHHGGRELPIDIPMFCSPEPTNKWDPKAVAIYHDREMSLKAAYLKRSDAAVVSELFQKGIISGPCYLKAKGPIEKITKRTEPQQKINIGFKCENEKLEIVKTQLQGHSYDVNFF